MYLEIDNPSQMEHKVSRVLAPFGVFEEVNTRFKIKDSKYGVREAENFKYKYKKHSGVSSA